MKKFIVALLCLVIFTPGIKSQNYLLENPDNHQYLGIRIGFDVSSMASVGSDAASIYDASSFRNRGGFSLGAIYNIPLWKNLYFEPGVSLFYNTFGYKFREVIPDYPEDYVLLQKRYFSTWGFRLPFNFGYHFDVTDDIQIKIFTGPQIDVNFSFSQHQKIKMIDPDFYKFDLGWNFGAGVQYDHYYLSVGGTVGMTSFIPKNTRHNIFSINLGYNF